MKLKRLGKLFSIHAVLNFVLWDGPARLLVCANTATTNRHVYHAI